VRASRARLRENAGHTAAGLSKLNSKRLFVEVDVDLGEPEHGRNRKTVLDPSTNLAATRGNSLWDP
jgi:hypothetical protein